MGVVCTHVGHIMAGHALKADPDICLDIAQQVAKMDGAIGKWKGIGDEYSASFQSVAWPGVISKNKARMIPTLLFSNNSRAGISRCIQGAGLRHSARHRVPSCSSYRNYPLVLEITKVSSLNQRPPCLFSILAVAFR